MFNFLSVFLQDGCKVAIYHFMKKYNILKINETGALIMPESTLNYMAKEKERRDDMIKNAKGKNTSVHQH
jgi:hypothetical protein